MQPEAAGERGTCFGPNLDGGRQPAEGKHEDDAQSRVTEDDRPVALDGRQAGGLQRLGEEAGGQRPRRSRDRPNEVVPGEHCRALRVRDRFGKGGLFDRQERPDLVARGADDTDRCRNDQQGEIPRGHEGDARPDHE